MTCVYIQNEWSKLEEVVLGIPEPIYFAAPHPIDAEPPAPFWKKSLAYLLFSTMKGKRAPKWLTNKFHNELESMKKILLEHDVVVHRPIPVMPRPDEPFGLGLMYSRDPIMAIGDTMFRGMLNIEMRRKELRGLDPILANLKENGDKVVRIPEGKNIFLEGGDVIVDLPYVFVGIGKYASNTAGIEWLRKQLPPDIFVVPVALRMPGVLHLDCCMTIIGPRLGIINRDSLQSPLPRPLDTYEFIEVDERTREELGTNVLMLDPKIIVIQERHRDLRKKLEAKGFTVIGTKYHWHALIGGAFRCTTAPIRRSNET